jgi:hypothetical protein
MDETTTSTGGNSWESWIQKASGSLLDAYGKNTQYNNDYQLQKLKIQSQNPYGQMYVDGQPVMGGMGGMSSSTLLLIGVAVVAVMLLKD